MFANMGLSKGTLETSGGLPTWSGTDVLPTEEEMRIKYKGHVADSGNQMADSDYALFNQRWGEVIGARHGRYRKEIRKLKNMGYDDDDIRNVIENNPVLAHNIGIITDNDPTDAYGKFYDPYMPKLPSQGLVGDVGLPEAALLGTGAYVAGKAGYDYVVSTPQSLINEAKVKFQDSLTSRQDNISTLKKELQAATKSGKKTKITKAKAALKKAQADIKTYAKKSSTELKRLQKGSQSTRWKTFNKGFGKNLKSLRAFKDLLLCYLVVQLVKQENLLEEKK